MRRVGFIVSLIVTVLARSGFGPNDQDWGYVTVREKAHMFWWLHYTTATENYTQRPLVIWLQGGPGGSSTGVGNFHEIGPWDMNQQDRNLSWVKFLNVLFVDNPVGTGFSYVEDSNNITRFAADNTAIAEDFMELLKGFFMQNPEFKNVPLYIFGQSYGGKMAADIALLLDQQIKAGHIDCRLKGIGLGDAWISPIDSLVNWPSYLLNLGFIDPEGFKTLTIVTDTVKALIDAGNFVQATRYFQATQVVINRLTTVDYYNVLQAVPTKIKNRQLMQPSKIHDTIELLREINLHDTIELWDDVSLGIEDHEDVDEELLNLMNGPVVSTLNLDIPIAWGDQSELVFQAVNVDFMKPVTNVIETILNTTDLEVTVYNGQLDLLVNTPGTITWVNNLQWKGAEEWKKANRTAIVIDNINDGYSKSYEKFHFYWINRAGHAVPTDNPDAMEYVIRQATHNYTNSHEN